MTTQGPRSVRQASTASGTTRALARAVVGEGLLPAEGLSDADVVALRALAASRSLVFPGESQPANTERAVRRRDRELVEAVRHLAAVRAGRSATVVLLRHDARAFADPLDLVRHVLDAVGAGECHLMLPVGRWLDELWASGAISDETEDDWASGMAVVPAV